MKEVYPTPPKTRQVIYVDASGKEGVFVIGFLHVNEDQRRTILLADSVSNIKEAEMQAAIYGLYYAKKNDLKKAIILSDCKATCVDKTIKSLAQEWGSVLSWIPREINLADPVSKDNRYMSEDTSWNIFIEALFPFIKKESEGLSRNQRRAKKESLNVTPTNLSGNATRAFNELNRQEVLPCSSSVFSLFLRNIVLKDDFFGVTNSKDALLLSRRIKKELFSKRKMVKQEKNGQMLGLIDV